MKFEDMFNPLAFKDAKKEDFRKAYAGKVDVDAAWKWIQKQLPKKNKKNGSGETNK